MLREYRDSNKSFIIAEVGQNHNGDLETAREFIKVYADAGADAIKFQTRDNKYLFSSESYEGIYNSENAFAKTYGKHREALELKIDDLEILKDDCEKNGTYFMSTPFDEPSLDVLSKLDTPLIKIASFDLGNLPLIDKIGKTKIPTVLSVGGGNANQIRSSVEQLMNYHDDIAVLHCVSEYPCEYNKLGLGSIKTLLSEFPGVAIGSSDHFNGTLSGPVAYLQGARIFEKHVTFNRAWKGTDHSFALEPEGFRKFARDIRRVEAMLMPKNKEEVGKEQVFKKLGKSLIASTKINAGDAFKLDNLSGRIFPDQHIPVRDSNIVIGKVSKRDIDAGEPILFDDLDE